MLSILPPLPSLPPLPEPAPTPWFPVSFDGWQPPVRTGWYEWRRAIDGGIERLWYNHKTGSIMAVGGNMPPMVWDAWRGLSAQVV